MPNTSFFCKMASGIWQQVMQLHTNDSIAITVFFLELFGGLAVPDPAERVRDGAVQPGVSERGRRGDNLHRGSGGRGPLQAGPPETFPTRRQTDQRAQIGKEGGSLPRHRPHCLHSPPSSRQQRQHFQQQQLQSTAATSSSARQKAVGRRRQQLVLHLPEAKQ